jgi:hypothetical protein
MKAIHEELRQLDKIIVTQRFSNKVKFTATAVELSEEGMLLEGPAYPADIDPRFVWLEFGLGVDDKKISALGEIVDSGPKTRVRFKHIFPDYKRELQDFLGADKIN